MNYDMLLVDGADNLEQVESLAADIFGVPTSLAPDGWRHDLLDTTVLISNCDYEDEPILPPVSHYKYIIDTTGSHQVEVADLIVKTIHNKFPEWAVLRLRDNGGSVQVISEPELAIC